MQQRGLFVTERKIESILTKIWNVECSISHDNRLYLNGDYAGVMIDKIVGHAHIKKATLGQEATKSQFGQNTKHYWNM